jgi:hypothetical protein
MSLAVVDTDMSLMMYSSAAAHEAFVGHFDNLDCILAGRNCPGQVVQVGFAWLQCPGSAFH